MTAIILITITTDTDLKLLRRLTAILPPGPRGDRNHEGPMAVHNSCVTSVLHCGSSWTEVHGDKNTLEPTDAISDLVWPVSAIFMAR